MVQLQSNLVITEAIFKNECLHSTKTFDWKHLRYSYIKIFEEKNLYIGSTLSPQIVPV